MNDSFTKVIRLATTPIFDERIKYRNLIFIAENTRKRDNAEMLSEIFAFFFLCAERFNQRYLFICLRWVENSHTQIQKGP